MGRVALVTLVTAAGAIGTVAIAACAIAACGSKHTPIRAPAPPAMTSPGPLALGHEKLACGDCHVDRSAALANDKCLDCHRTLRDRLGAGKGYHARATTRGKPCEHCHHDHRGPAYDLMGWDSVRFDHAQTGWPLDGAHAGATCAACHHTLDAAGRSVFAGTDRTCGACHATSPHGFTALPLLACDRCHTVQGWAPPRPQMRFDHDDRQDAAMPLLGVHKNVACAKCHPAARFALGGERPDDCAGCHASPHAHDIANARPCAQCHSPTFKSFRSSDFDHTMFTRFELAGAHRRLPCDRCHTPALGSVAPPRACEACHPGRSPHQQRFAGIPCADCHTALAYIEVPGGKPKWRPAGFDHHDPLLHRIERHDRPCRDCHRGQGPAEFERLAPASDCTGCHRHKTVHEGKYSNAQCFDCHRRSS